MDVRSRGWALLVGVGVLTLGVILQQFTVMPAIVVDPAVAFEPREASRVGLMLMLPLNFLGLALAGAVYLRYIGADWSWLDLNRPGAREALWMIGGTIVIILALLVIGLIAQLIEAEPPDQWFMEVLEQDVVLIVFMIAVVWLFNAPAEEFLFRNVIQKRLYDDFSGISAVVIASVLFAGVHVLTLVFVGHDPVGILIPIVGIFIGSVVMGYAYLVTANLWVPIVIHALYNSFQMVILLLTVVYDIDPDAAATLLALVSLV